MRKGKGTDERRNHKDEATRPALRTFAQFTPLNAPRAQIFHLHQNSKLWERPPPSRRLENNSNQFCDFHGNPGHSTKSRRTLKNNLEDLIQRGYFKIFVKWNDEQKRKTEAENKRNPGPSQDEGEAKRQKKAPIFVIFEKFRGMTDGEAHLRVVT